MCDAFNAMTSHRPYQTPRSYHDAENELRRCAGTQFDPVVVDAFCRAAKPPLQPHASRDRCALETAIFPADRPDRAVGRDPRRADSAIRIPSSDA